VTPEQPQPGPSKDPSNFLATDPYNKDFGPQHFDLVKEAVDAHNAAQASQTLQMREPPARLRSPDQVLPWDKKDHEGTPVGLRDGSVAVYTGKNTYQVIPKALRDTVIIDAQGVRDPRNAASHGRQITPMGR
jgi:hypothetical protein